jgi:hypothetical protein
MVNLIAWCILSYGLMNIMVYGSIFKNFRQFFINWGNNEYAPLSGVGTFISGILGCPMCFSVWSGFFLGLVVASPSYWFFGTSQYYSWFFDGILSSGAVWAINSIIEWFEQNRPTNNNN